MLEQCKLCTRMDPGIDLPRAASQENVSKGKQAGVYVEAEPLNDVCGRAARFNPDKSKARAAS